MAKLNKNNLQIKFKRGVAANINTDATKYLASQGEPHYTTDTKQLYVFDGTTNVLAGVLNIDTRANILALTATIGQIAYATDVKSFYVADGTNWRRADLTFETDLQAPDMGYEKNNPKTGYHADWLTDKNLHNVAIKGSNRNETGGLRIDTTQDPDTFEVYLRGAWQDILYDLTVENSDLRHTPLSEAIYVWSGQSVKNGLNGRPIINEYKVSMGAFPAPRAYNCGTF